MNMKNTILPMILAGLALAFSIVAINKSESGIVGGVTNYDIVDVTDGYRVDGSTIIDGSGDATFTNDVTITNANTSTSSLEVGCIETTATSTATPVKLVLGKVGSGATTTLYDTSAGGVYWAYGTCN